MAEGTLPQERSIFYVYVIFRPDGRPCYVGMGRGGRWKRHFVKSHNRHLASIVAQAGGALPIVKVREKIQRDEAISTEIALIAAIGREANGGPLVNQSDGGEGPAGMRMSAAWRARRSEAAKQVWQDPVHRAIQAERKTGNQNSKKPHTLSAEWRETLADKMRGNQFTLGLVHSAESRAAMSAVRKGKAKTKEHREAIAAALRGSRRSDAARANMSASQKGKTLSQATRQKIAAATKGREKSAETRAKMSAALAARWKDPEYAERMTALNRARSPSSCRKPR